MTQKPSSYEHGQAPVDSSEISRKLGSTGTQEAKPLDGSLDTSAPATKAQAIIEMVKRGNDDASTDILNDFPEAFSAQEISDFSDVVSERYQSGKPMYFLDYKEALPKWGIPVLGTSDNPEVYGYGPEHEVEHYTELLDEALSFLGSKELPGQLVDGQVIGYDEDPLVDAYVLGSAFDGDDETLRQTDLEIIGSAFENHETHVESAEGKTTVKNAVVRVLYGYEDSNYGTERAAYVTDITVDDKGNVARDGEPSAIFSRSGNVIKDFPEAEDQ